MTQNLAGTRYKAHVTAAPADAAQSRQPPSTTSRSAARPVCLFFSLCARDPDKNDEAAHNSMPTLHSLVYFDDMHQWVALRVPLLAALRSGHPAAHKHLSSNRCQNAYTHTQICSSKYPIALHSPPHHCLPAKNIHRRPAQALHPAIGQEGRHQQDWRAIYSTAAAASMLAPPPPQKGKKRRLAS